MFSAPVFAPAAFASWSIARNTSLRSSACKKKLPVGHLCLCARAMKVPWESECLLGWVCKAPHLQPGKNVLLLQRLRHEVTNLFHPALCAGREGKLRERVQAGV